MTSALSAPENIRTVVLNAGDFHFGDRETRISTLLGSCVSITLWHPRKKIGGMCHYMLTQRKIQAGNSLDGRYASDAFELFLQHVAKQHTRPSEYQAKLFGGANMFGKVKSEQLDIGTHNIEYGIQFLTSHNITLVSRHVGGSGRRKLHFDIWSGDVWLAFPDGEGAVITDISSK